MPLVPCEACRRHVRAVESACPFCKAVRGATTVAVTAVAALTIAGCETFSPSDKYGGPPARPDTTLVGPPASTTAPTTSSPRLDPPAAPSTSSAPVHAPASKYGGPARPPGRPNDPRFD